MKILDYIAEKIVTWLTSYQLWRRSKALKSRDPFIYP